MRWQRILLGIMILSCLVWQVGAEEGYRIKQTIESFETLIGWKAAGDHQGPETAINFVAKPTIEGKGAAELVYHFIGSANTLNFCEYIKPIMLPGKCDKLNFWVHSDGSGHTLRVRLIDSSGEYLQYTVGDLSWMGWREMSINIPRPNGYWGGDGDGKPTYPVRFNSFIIDSKARTCVDKGRIYVDELVVEAQIPASESLEFSAESAKVGNIFTLEEPVKFNLVFNNYADVKRELDVNYWVNSTSERMLANGTFQVKVGARAKANSELVLPVKTNGSFNLTLYIRSTDRVIRMQKEMPFSRVLPQPQQRGEGIFGVCTHFAQHKGEIDKNISLAALAGANWIRDEMYWGAAEPVKGEIKVLPEWDRYVDTALEHDLNVLLILSYGNKFYDDGKAPYTPEGMAAFTRYATTLAEHFKGRINHFEIWNEWNGGMGNQGRQTPEVYAELLKSVYPAIKAVNPEAVIIGGVTAGTDLGWIERVLKAGGYDYMDAVSIHPYSYPTSPDEGGFIKNLELTQELMIRYGGAKPVHVTEIGWPTQEDRRGVTELMSGAYGVRMYVLGMASGIPATIFWYDLQNDGVDKKYNEDNFGLLHCWHSEVVPWSAKGNYLAYNTMTKMLTGIDFIGAYQQENKSIFRFRRADGKDVLVLWTIKGSETIGLKTSGNNVTMVDLFGNKVPLSTVAGVITVTISEVPLYLEGDFETLELVAPTFVLDGADYKVVAGEAVLIRVKLPGEYSGQFFADLPGGWQLEGETKFAAQTSSTELAIKVAPSASEKTYELLLYPISDNKILGQLKVVAQVINPLEITVSPRLADHSNWNKWELVLEIGNHSALQALSGTITVREPVGWSERIKPISFRELKPGEKQRIIIEVPTLPAEATTQFLLQVSLNTGQLLTFQRQVSFLAAVRAKQTPKIDGELSEWKGAMPFVLNQANQIKQISNWGGPGDLSGKGYLMWDNANLYLALEVTDNQHFQNGVGSDIWQGDGIQFTIDPGRISGPGSIGYHEIGFALSGTEVVNWRWIAASGFDVGSVTNFVGAIRRDGTKTTYEAAIPWSELVPGSMELKAGTLLGFSLLINDNDGTGRRGWIEYMSGIGQSKDPFAFGDLVLTE